MKRFKEQLRLNNSIKTVDKKGRPRSDKIHTEGNASTGQPKPGKNRSNKVPKLAEPCGSRLGKLHQTTLSMFAVKKSAKKSSTKKSIKKSNNGKNSADKSKPGTSTKTDSQMQNPTDIASRLTSTSCFQPSSSLFSYAAEGHSRCTSGPYEHLDSIFTAHRACLDGRRNHRGDDNIDSEADMEDDGALVSCTLRVPVECRVSGIDKTVALGASLSPFSDVIESTKVQTNKRSAFAASAFDRFVDSTIRRQQHIIQQRRMDDEVSDSGTFQQGWCPMRSTIGPCCSSQSVTPNESRNLQGSCNQYNPAFRVSAPAHVGTLKYRSGPVLLPRLKWAEEQSVWNLMCWKDTIYCRNPHMMPQHPGLQPRMRAILIDWLSEVCEEYKLHRETFYLAIDFIDRFLSKEQNVSKDNQQLIGVTALFVAAKLEEIYPPKRSLFADITAGACTAADIETMEMVLLKTLNWALCPITAIHWLSTYMQIVDSLEDRNNHCETCTDCASGTSGIWPVINNHSDACGLDDCVYVTNSGSIEPRSETPVPYLSSQNRRSCRSRRHNTPISGIRKKGDLLFSNYQRYHFIHVARLIDLCIMDAGSLKFPYSILAACAFAHIVEPENLALRVSGFKYDDVAVCYHWMIPFARCVQEKGDLSIKPFYDIPDDDMHNIQSHAVDLKMLEAVSLKNSGVLSEPKLPVAELKRSLYTIGLEQIPGWRRMPDGEVRLLKEGRKWIHQKCFVLTRNGADVGPFLERCTELFSTHDVESILDLVNKAVDKAAEINVKTAFERKDKESEFLTNLTNSLTYNDVPGLLEDRNLSEVSALWLQDKIRRIMRRNLHCLNAFLLKITCMFRSNVIKVFSDVFKDEIKTMLLPSYRGKLDLLKEWMSKPTQPNNWPETQVAVEGTNSAFSSAGSYNSSNVPEEEHMVTQYNRFERTHSTQFGASVYANSFSHDLTDEFSNFASFTDGEAYRIHSNAPNPRPTPLMALDPIHQSIRPANGLTRFWPAQNTSFSQVSPYGGTVVSSSLIHSAYDPTFPNRPMLSQQIGAMPRYGPRPHGNISISHHFPMGTSVSREPVMMRTPQRMIQEPPLAGRRFVPYAVQQRGKILQPAGGRSRYRKI